MTRDYAGGQAGFFSFCLSSAIVLAYAKGKTGFHIGVRAGHGQREKTAYPDPPWQGTNVKKNKEEIVELWHFH
jgi:hypothetical protein